MLNFTSYVIQRKSKNHQRPIFKLCRDGNEAIDYMHNKTEDIKTLPIYLQVLLQVICYLETDTDPIYPISLLVRKFSFQLKNTDNSIKTQRKLDYDILQNATSCNMKIGDEVLVRNYKKQPNAAL